MKVEQRNTILEVVDILRALSGNNGFGNLQPKVKHLLGKYAVDLKKIVEDDISTSGEESRMTKEEFLKTY